MAVCRPSPDAPARDTEHPRPEHPAPAVEHGGVSVRLWGSAPKTLPGSPLEPRRLFTGAAGAGSVLPALCGAHPPVAFLLAAVAVAPSGVRRLARERSPVGRAVLALGARTRPVPAPLVDFLACSATFSSSKDVGWARAGRHIPVGSTTLLSRHAGS